MWRAEISCPACEGTHVVCSELDGQPRAFAFECPRDGERVSVRFRDPSVMIEPWARVATCPVESIPVLASEQRGALE